MCSCLTHIIHSLVLLNTLASVFTAGDQQSTTVYSYFVLSMTLQGCTWVKIVLRLSARLSKKWLTLLKGLYFNPVIFS